MILVKCTHCDKTDDNGRPCILLTTDVVSPVKTKVNDGEGVEWETAIWWNNTEELLPDRPSSDKKLGLVAYPHGTAPVVIADKHGIGAMWGRQLMFFFFIYNMLTDVSDCVGRVYSVEVIGSERDGR
jgi:hypothetical protein